jgi:hypothetical protein
MILDREQQTKQMQEQQQYGGDYGYQGNPGAGYDMNDMREAMNEDVPI